MEIERIRKKTEHKEPVQFVLDGGSLLHKLTWPKGLTFDEISNLYTDYVQSQFGRPVVIFDGYIQEPSTKDITHIRRSKGISRSRLHSTDALQA